MNAAAAPVALPLRRAGGGGKRARMGAVPVLAAIMEGVPSLAEEDGSGSVQRTVDDEDSQAVTVNKAVIGPDGEVEAWDVQQQQASQVAGQ